MNRLLIYPYSLCLLLLLVLHASKAIHIWDLDLEGEEREEFIKDCQTNSTCGGIDITYPFRLNSTPAYCGVQGLEVSCSAAGDAIITIPGLGPCKIINLGSFVTIKLLGDEWAQCPLQKLSSINLTGSIYQLESSYYNNDYSSNNYTLMNCSSQIATDPYWITGPIPCLSNGSQGEWVYVANHHASMDPLLSGCVGTGIGGWIGYAGKRTFGDLVQGFIQTLQMDVSLNIPEWKMCRYFWEFEGKQCGFSRSRNQTACLTRPYLEGEEGEEFIKDCETNSTCGGIHIRYPFRLNSTPAYCGVQGLEVSCSKTTGDAIITLPRLGPCKIIYFDTPYFIIIELLGNEWAQCPLQKLSSINLTGSIYQLDSYSNYKLVNCSSEIARDPDWITGAISCLSDGSEGQLVYAADAWASMDQLPYGCVTTEIGGWVRYADIGTFGDQVQGFIQTLQMYLHLNIPELEKCSLCYEEGKQCGFSRRRNQTACLMSTRPHDNLHSIILTFLYILSITCKILS